MENRDKTLADFRPDIPSANVSDNMTSDEKFQNSCLRPIVKLQNELLIAVFRNYIKKHKNVFYDLTPDERLNYIENTLQKDTKFRNSLKGMVVGMFTLQEYELYRQNSSALNKRLMHIVKERLQSNVMLFEKKTTE